MHQHWIFSLIITSSLTTQITSGSKIRIFFLKVLSSLFPIYHSYFSCCCRFDATFDLWCNVESSQWYFKYIYGYKQHLMNFRLMFRSSIGLYQLSLAHFVSRRFPRSLNRSKSSGTMAMSGVNSGSEDLSSSFLTLEKIDVNIYRYFRILKETVIYRYPLLFTR